MRRGDALLADVGCETAVVVLDCGVLGHRRVVAGGGGGAGDACADVGCPHGD
jgi:hypothetical protein